MKSINRIVIVGRMVRDSEMSYTNSGTAILNCSIAYSRSVKRNDQWEDKACFIDFTLWGKRAEGLNPYLLKGQQVAIDGELDFEKWDDKDGNKRSRHKIIVENIELLGGKKEGSGYTPEETGTSEEYNADIF